MERLEQYTKGLHLATKHKATLLHARFAWCSPDVAWCLPDVDSVFYSYVCLSGITALWLVPQRQCFISCCSESIFTTLPSRLVIPWISFESNTPFHKQANFFFIVKTKLAMVWIHNFDCMLDHKRCHSTVAMLALLTALFQVLYNLIYTVRHLLYTREFRLEASRTQT